MHYVKSWTRSLWTYIASYTGVIATLYYYYGSRLTKQVIGSAVVDVTYYFATFVWLVLACVLAIRIYEMTERKSFYGSYQQERETEELKKLWDMMILLDLC